MSRGVRSILTSQQGEMIDMGGKARRAGAGSVLRTVETLDPECQRCR